MVKKMSFGIEIDWNACTGCSTCYKVWPSECFGEPVEGNAVIIEENRNYCQGCRGCEAP